MYIIGICFSIMLHLGRIDMNLHNIFYITAKKEAGLWPGFQNWVSRNTNLGWIGCPSFGHPCITQEIWHGVKISDGCPKDTWTPLLQPWKEGGSDLVFVTTGQFCPNSRLFVCLRFVFIKRIAHMYRLWNLFLDHAAFRKDLIWNCITYFTLQQRKKEWIGRQWINQHLVFCYYRAAL